MPSWKSPWNAPGCALWSLWGGLRFGKAAVWHVFTLDAGSWLEFGGWGGWQVATQTISYDISLSTQAYEETVNQGRASPQENIQEALLDFKPNCSVFACLLYVHTPNNPTIHLPGFRQGTYANTCSCRGLSKRACRGQCSHPKGQKLIWHITLRYLFKFTHILYFFFNRYSYVRITGVPISLQKNMFTSFGDVKLTHSTLMTFKCALWFVTY